MKGSLDIYNSIALGYPVSVRAFPHHALVDWVKALEWGVRLIRAFDAGGSKAALRRLPCVPSHAPFMSAFPREQQIRKAQLDAACLRSLLRFLLDARACFSESLALCAGLRCLGWDCAVIVGYARVELFASTPMHAWVDYLGMPLSDVLDVHYSYLEVQRYNTKKERSGAIL